MYYVFNERNERNERIILVFIIIIICIIKLKIRKSYVIGMFMC